MASATGISTSEIELLRIVEFCNLYDSFYLDRDVEPKLSQNRYGYGSRKEFSDMHFEAAHELLGYPLEGVFRGRDASVHERDIMSGKVCCY